MSSNQEETPSHPQSNEQNEKPKGPREENQRGRERRGRGRNSNRGGGSSYYKVVYVVKGQEGAGENQHSENNERHEENKEERGGRRRRRRGGRRNRNQRGREGQEERPRQSQENHGESKGEAERKGEGNRQSPRGKKVNSKYISLNRFENTEDCHLVILKNLANYRDQVEVFGSGGRIEDLLSLHLDYSKYYKLVRLSKAGRARLRLSFVRQDDFYHNIRKDYEEVFRRERPILLGDNFRQQEVSSLLIRNVRVAVVRGNVAYEDSDLIVNLTDANFNHGFGVAHDIYVNAGENVFHEGLEEIKKREKVEGGEVVVTSSGNLAEKNGTKNIAHLIVPDWDQSDLEAKINSALVNIFKSAEEHHLNSLSLTVFSSGDHRFPEDKSINLTLTSIQEYFKGKSNSSVGHVRLVSSEEKTISNLSNTLPHFKLPEKKVIETEDPPLVL